MNFEIVIKKRQQRKKYLWKNQKSWDLNGSLAFKFHNLCIVSFFLWEPLRTALWCCLCLCWSSLAVSAPIKSNSALWIWYHWIRPSTWQTSISRPTIWRESPPLGSSRSARFPKITGFLIWEIFSATFQMLLTQRVSRSKYFKTPTKLFRIICWSIMAAQFNFTTVTFLNMLLSMRLWITPFKEQFSAST